MRFNTLLDVGSGSGFFARQLLRNTGIKSAICVDTGYSSDSDDSFEGKPLLFRRSSANVSGDLVLLMDVLEHVEYDERLLKSYVEPAARGAYFLISVPAFQFMWSPHDEFLEHKKRYTVKEVERIVSSAGLSVINCHYYYAGVFPFAMVVRLLPRLWCTGSPTKTTNLRRHSFVVNKLLYILSILELYIMSKNKWFGLTVVCVAKKNSTNIGNDDGE